MCAAALARLGVGRVVFGCGNSKFGGCGTVLDVFSPVSTPLTSTGTSDPSFRSSTEPASAETAAILAAPRSDETDGPSLAARESATVAAVHPSPLSQSAAVEPPPTPATALLTRGTSSASLPFTPATVLRGGVLAPRAIDLLQRFYKAGNVRSEFESVIYALSATKKCMLLGCSLPHLNAIINN
jgi:hypothetical protein